MVETPAESPAKKKAIIKKKPATTKAKKAKGGKKAKGKKLSKLQKEIDELKRQFRTVRPNGPIGRWPRTSLTTAHSNRSSEYWT